MKKYLIISAALLSLLVVGHVVTSHFLKFYSTTYINGAGSKATHIQVRVGFHTNPSQNLLLIDSYLPDNEMPFPKNAAAHELAVFSKRSAAFQDQGVQFIHWNVATCYGNKGCLIDAR